MKWFMHLSKSRHDSDLKDAFILFGAAADRVFWYTLEMIAEDFNADKPGVVTLTMHGYLEQLKYRRKKVLKILDFFSSRPIDRHPKRIEYRIFTKNGLEMIELQCEKLEDLSDNWTQAVLRKKTTTKCGV